MTEVGIVSTPSDNAKYKHSLRVRILAAQVAVLCSERTGRPVDPRVKELAELPLPTH
jgi:hypothetical protein